MADFRLPGAGYSRDFKNLPIRGGALVTLWGGAGVPDPVGPLEVDVDQSTVVSVKELEPNPAWDPHLRLFRLAGLKRGSAVLTARWSKGPIPKLYCELKLEVVQPQEDFVVGFVSKIDLGAFRTTGIAPSVMLGQACVESGFGGRDSKTRTINPQSRVVVSNTIFGITKRPGTMPWFTKCKTIVSSTESVAGQGTQPDWFCVAGDYQGALDVYVQLVTENPGADLMHRELNFADGNPDYGSEIMKMPLDLVMICQWASLFTQSMDSRMTICSGGSNGSVGVGYNTSVPSEPQIDVSLAQLPKSERNPLSARARSSVRHFERIHARAREA